MGNKKNLGWFERYLMKLNDVLLWVFISSMVMIALIYIFNVEQLNFEVVDPVNDIVGSDYYLNKTSLAVISQEDLELQQDFYYEKFWIALICILGWMAVHPKFLKNFRGLFKDVENK